jgi:hypothetical protein
MNIFLHALNIIRSNRILFGNYSVVSLVCLILYFNKFRRCCYKTMHLAMDEPQKTELAQSGALLNVRVKYQL